MSARPEIMEAIRLATLAPSRYNTQPWIFVMSGEQVRIFPDPIRKLAVVDAEERELHVSLGSALRMIARSALVTRPSRFAMSLKIAAASCSEVLTSP